MTWIKSISLLKNICSKNRFKYEERRKTVPNDRSSKSRPYRNPLIYFEISNILLKGFQNFRNYEQKVEDVENLWDTADI